MQVLLLIAWVTLATADVRLPPKITEHPELLHIYEGGDQNYLMPCVAEGIPKVVYSWKKNGEEFEQNRQNIKVNPNTGSFTFISLSVLDEGYYQCFAKNQYGLAISQVAMLQQAVLGTFTTLSEPRQYTANVGDYLMLACNAPPCFPEPKFSWVIADKLGDNNPTEVIESKRLTIDLKGNLHFGNVIQNDQMGTKIYMCKMYNPNLRTTKEGSESKIEVIFGRANNSIPEVKFKPEATEIVVAGSTVEFQCLFAGYPTPEVSFMKVGEGPLTGRKKPTRYGTGMEISNVTEGDAGTYRCTGTNINGQTPYEFKIEVEVKPVFEAESDMPHDVNATNGDTATFTCNAKGKPEADVQWFQNGVPIDSNDPGPNMKVEDNGKKLSIRDLCKTCASGGSDLMVIQCNASNSHGYVFADGYLNVLLKTVLTEIPKDINMTDWEVDVMFPCKASSDPSTPVTIKWYFNDVEIDPDNKGYEILDDGLKVDAALLENQMKGKAEGNYTCTANNGWTKASHKAYLTLPQTVTLTQMTPTQVPSISQIEEASMNWLLIVIPVVVVLLLISVIILVCCIYRQRSMQDEYSVDEKEKAAGLDPEKELIETGFQAYERPEARSFKGSQASLVSHRSGDSAFLTSPRGGDSYA